MGQESKTIQPTQEDIDIAVEGILRKSESPKEKAWRELEEQMASQEGLEGIKIPDWAKSKKELDPEAVEKKQAFWTEFGKWENFYSMGAMGIAGEDLPSHLDPDINFKNQNKLEIPVGFADYLISKALSDGSKELVNELKNILEELDEIEFADILKSSNLVLLTLKSENKKIALAFEVKYPFKFRNGKIFQRND
ncbi:MAG: hypothetical protein Q7S34_04125 [bacterium]|nr:hypothetical protein [bacterium]